MYHAYAVLAKAIDNFNTSVGVGSIEYPFEG